jgi:hypothetical protein
MLNFWVFVAYSRVTFTFTLCYHPYAATYLQPKQHYFTSNVTCHKNELNTERKIEFPVTTTTKPLTFHQLIKKFRSAMFITVCTTTRLRSPSWSSPIRSIPDALCILLERGTQMGMPGGILWLSDILCPEGRKGKTASLDHYRCVWPNSPRKILPSITRCIYCGSTQLRTVTIFPRCFQDKWEPLFSPALNYRAACMAHLHTLLLNQLVEQSVVQAPVALSMAPYTAS